MTYPKVDGSRNGPAATRTFRRETLDFLKKSRNPGKEWHQLNACRVCADLDSVLEPLQGWVRAWEVSETFAHGPSTWSVWRSWEKHPTS